MRIEQLRQRLAALGAKPCHVARVLRAWSLAVSLDNRRSRAEDFLPQAVRAALPDLLAELAGLVRLRSEHPGADGSSRLLVELADRQTVESVLLPRDGLCVSTQVGCAVGCLFCMTGKEGLLRQLGSAEIVAQVALARTRRAVRRVVFMGERLNRFPAREKLVKFFAGGGLTPMPRWAANYARAPRPCPAPSVSDARAGWQRRRGSHFARLHAACVARTFPEDGRT